jgi:hypothetical protein
VAEYGVAVVVAYVQRGEHVSGVIHGGYEGCEKGGVLEVTCAVGEAVADEGEAHVEGALMHEDMMGVDAILGAP